MNSQKILFLLALLLCSPSVSFANMSIVYTKHNLSVSGQGEIKALSETRICVFCHTPHNSTPQTPLWNREIKPINYITYSSSTMTADIPQPTGPTRLCLSCHDGTIALGNVLSVPGGIQTTMEIAAESRSFIGTDISNDHPVSFSYNRSLPHAELQPDYPEDLMPYPDNKIHCSTCHDAHNNIHGKFLVADNTYSALCRKCHVMNGWTMSSHRTSTKPWSGGGIDPWPHTSWDTVAENGCENCHTPHNAQGSKRLMNYLREEDNCFPCHTGAVASKDILADIIKASAHPVDLATIGIGPTAHDPAENPVGVSGHVECADCHNSHAAFASSSPAPPQVSGRLAMVSGVNQYGAAVETSAYEYEICFKCHADGNSLPPRIERYINETNTRLEFNLINPSYHPVITQGKNSLVPSIPSTYESELTVTSRIYCTDCHDSDESPEVGGAGPKGPHGSIYEPILKDQYVTDDNTIESFANYALCYRCHDRTSILNDESFQKNTLSGTGAGGHSGHLNGHDGRANRATCSVCHDPHGIFDDGVSGSHSHLINFDSLLVSPAAGQSVPFFVDKGTFAGSCTLICHGFTHNNTNSNYP